VADVFGYAHASVLWAIWCVVFSYGATYIQPDEGELDVLLCQPADILSSFRRRTRGPAGAPNPPPSMTGNEQRGGYSRGTRCAARTDYAGVWE